VSRGEQPIGLQQLGDNRTELLGNGLDRRGFGRQPWNVLARGNPDADFRIPIRMDVVYLRHLVNRK
jgi:hypothetical protein